MNAGNATVTGHWPGRTWKAIVAIPEAQTRLGDVAPFLHPAAQPMHVLILIEPAQP